LVRRERRPIAFKLRQLTFDVRPTQKTQKITQLFRQGKAGLPQVLLKQLSEEELEKELPLKYGEDPRDKEVIVLTATGKRVYWNWKKHFLVSGSSRTS
jgi:hypothetical protein